MGWSGRVAGKIARGDIRLFRFPEPDKQRPVLVLTRDSIIDRLSRITVAPVTSTIRGVASEVVLGPNDGMKDLCAINLQRGDAQPIGINVTGRLPGSPLA